MNEGREKLLPSCAPPHVCTLFRPFITRQVDVKSLHNAHRNTGTPPPATRNKINLAACAAPLPRDNAFEMLHTQHASSDAQAMSEDGVAQVVVVGEDAHEGAVRPRSTDSVESTDAEVGRRLARRTRHRRSDTLGSAVTDFSGELSRARSHTAARPPLSPARRRRSTVADDVVLPVLERVAGRAALRTHALALGQLRDALREARRALALARADGSSRDLRKAWNSTNSHHRSAVAAAEHLRLWAAAHPSAVAATDVDVRHGAAVLPPFHALEIVAAFASAARNRRRVAILERATQLLDHLETRQEQFLEIVRVHALALPLQRFSKSKSFS